MCNIHKTVVVAKGLNSNRNSVPNTIYRFDFKSAFFYFHSASNDLRIFS